MMDLDEFMGSVHVKVVKREDGEYVEQKIQNYAIWFDEEKRKYMFTVMLDD